MPLLALLYDAHGHDREVKLEDVRLDRLGRDNLLWLDVLGREEEQLQNIAEILGVDREAFEGLFRERPHLENYGDFFRFSVDAAPVRNGPNSSPAPVPSEAEGSDVAGSVRIEFLVSERWLITLHEGDLPCFEQFREQDKAETLIGLLTGQALAASLLDRHLGAYFDEVSRIEAAVDKLDERVLRETASKSLLGRMVALRRRVSKLRGLLVDQRDVFYGLSRPDFALVTDSGAAPFYQALVGRFERAIDEVERTRDVVVGSFELFTSRTTQQTNDLVKVLTFLTAIVGFCAAIAGLMGMNFKLAFFETGLTGFAMVTGGLGIVAAIAVVYARYKQWI